MNSQVRKKKLTVYSLSICKSLMWMTCKGSRLVSEEDDVDDERGGRRGWAKGERKLACFFWRVRLVRRWDKLGGGRGILLQSHTGGSSHRPKVLAQKGTEAGPPRDMDLREWARMGAWAPSAPWQTSGSWIPNPVQKLTRVENSLESPRWAIEMSGMRSAWQDAHVERFSMEWASWLTRSRWV
jgi:hypothetical protein